MLHPGFLPLGWHESFDTLVDDDLLDMLLSGGGTVDFQEFVGGLSAFSSRGGREEKLRCGSHIFES